MRGSTAPDIIYKQIMTSSETTKIHCFISYYSLKTFFAEEKLIALDF